MQEGGDEVKRSLAWSGMTFIKDAGMSQMVFVKQEVNHYNRMNVPGWMSDGMLHIRVSVCLGFYANFFPVIIYVFSVWIESVLVDMNKVFFMK